MKDKMTLVPPRMKNYVSWGHFKDLRAIIMSEKFVPVFITGLSGNGKTLMVEQVCATIGRNMVRVNITRETDEDDLLGGFRLKDGSTVWENGPVVTAMEEGAVLLLDEIDLGTEKMMCLQPILEGNPVYLKKINKLVKPAKGFCVVATANTKGQGSISGKFIGTNVLNEAFLERFSFTLEQSYPTPAVEKKIVGKQLVEDGVEDGEFAESLVKWANLTRESFFTGACSELISTRRLIHICQAYSIFGMKREKAIKICLNRFDEETRESFYDFYTKIDAEIRAEIEAKKKAEADKIEAQRAAAASVRADIDDVVKKAIDGNAKVVHNNNAMTVTLMQEDEVVEVITRDKYNELLEVILKEETNKANNEIKDMKEKNTKDFMQSVTGDSVDSTLTGDTEMFSDFKWA